MKQSILWFATLSGSLVVGNATVGCGTDDATTGGAGATGGSGGTTGSGGGAGAGKAGSAGSGGTAGRAGSAGSSGAGGSAGSAGSAGAGGAKDSGTDTGTTLQCGTAMCSSFDDPDLGTLTPCCAPGETNACGLSFMGICFTTTPGTSNPLCPDVTLPTQTGGMVTLPGCCTATGVCGGDLGTPLGCNPLTPFTGQPGTPCGGDAGQPPPPSDSGADVGPSSDAGGDATDAADSGPSNDANPSDSGSTDSSDVRAADVRTDGPG